MSWIAVAVAGGAAIAGAGAYLGGTNSPGNPGQRNLNTELSGIGGGYNNALNNIQGGYQNFTNNSLGNLGTITRGAFDPNAFFAARPDAAQDWLDHFTNGQNAGWTAEQFANAYDADASKNYTSGGIGDLAGSLNTQSRTNNLADANSLGSNYVNLMRGANPGYYGALDSFTNSANAPVIPGQSQQLAAQNAQQGFGSFNPSGLYANAQSVSAPGGMLNVRNQNVFAQQGNPLLSQLNQQAMNQGPSGLQQQQNTLASGLLAQGGQLSPGELRNVQQSSRAGFAARGLDATNASVVDEAMQTDAAQRARLMQNLGIAQGVQNQGLAEQGQQQQFGLGVGSQNFGYGQLGLQGQQSNQGANLQSQIANQGAYQNLNSLNLQSQLANQGANLQAQQLNQNFGLGAFGANLQSQTAQQQALMQSAGLQEQQRQAQLAAQAQAVSAQRAGYLDPYSAILGGTDPNLLGSAMNQNTSNLGAQTSLYNSLLGYGGDLYNTNYNANAANQIARYNGQQSTYGSLIGLGGNLMGAGLGACWVAREVYGVEDDRWMIFRDWLLIKAPAWFRSLYLKHGEKFAVWLHCHPSLKPPIRRWMDGRIATLNLT